MKPRRVRVSLAALLVGICLHPSPASSQTTAPTAPQPNPERQAFFGETHVHTSWSFDAFIFGNHVTGPADAYKYAKGETIKHPLGYDIKITTPLDWMGVTDHSEYVGTVRLANEPGSFMSKLPIALQDGWHAIFVDALTPGHVPGFEEVEPEVRTSWNADRRTEAWSRAYEKMRAKYQLVLPAPPADAAP
jgi:hypothetical protein